MPFLVTICVEFAYYQKQKELRDFSRSLLCTELYLHWTRIKTLF